MRGEIINLVVALSNVFGLWPLYTSYYNTDRFFYYEPHLIFVMIIATFLMHISERKHNLPGLLFGNYSNYLLWFDRIMAWIMSFYVFLIVIDTVLLIMSNDGTKGLYNNLSGFGLVFFDISMALASLHLSERIEPNYNSQEWFAFWHIIWHYLAYDILYRVIN